MVFIGTKRSEGLFGNRKDLGEKSSILYGMIYRNFSIKREFEIEVMEDMPNLELIVEIPPQHESDYDIMIFENYLN